MKTGIDEIELRILEMKEIGKVDSLENLTKILSMKKRKTFTNYLTPDDLIPNLDSLLEGESEPSNSEQKKP